MRVFVTGASGLIGTHLLPALIERGDEVTALSRTARESSPGLRWIRGDIATLRDWEGALADCQAIVNLAGAPISQRWTDEQMRRIVSSRVGITTALFHALAHAASPPTALISASGVGFYGTDPTQELDEASPPGTGFLAKVCQEWEAAAQRAEALNVRVVRFRLGPILAAEGGMLAALIRPLRAFLGGALGSGQQWISWIQILDVVALICAALDNADWRGAINATAPEPVRQRELVKTLGQRIGRPAWLDAPSFAVRLMMGRMAQEMLLEGQRVMPRRAVELGFHFRYPKLQAALDASLESR